MSFVSVLALLIGVLAVVPLIAHLFQRGRARTVEFPPTRWVDAEAHVATRPKRIDDVALLVVRMSLLLLLAVMGAVPLVRCNDKRLDRTSGASIARILVIDDSGSMAAKQDDRRSRFDAGLTVARNLVGQMREGDSVGIVLGGKPARVALAPTESVSTLTRELDRLEVSHRPTDLGGALTLARSILQHLPQRDRRSCS
ncbi:MAG: VWA domain-containing protein [Polyangiaceae bacterium]